MTLRMWLAFGGVAVFFAALGYVYAMRQVATLIRRKQLQIDMLYAKLRRAHDPHWDDRRNRAS